MNDYSEPELSEIREKVLYILDVNNVGSMNRIYADATKRLPRLEEEYNGYIEKNEYLQKTD